MSIFKSWVAPSVGKCLLFALLIPNMMMFFLPVANEEVAAGYWGIETNDVQFTIILYYVGFASFYSLERRFFAYFASKQYFILFQTLQLLCCWILFSTQFLPMIFAVRFFQGMLFASAVNLYMSLVAKMMKTFRAKEMTYSLFFGMLLCTSGINSLVTADIIDHYNFNVLFKWAMSLYGLSLLVVLVFVKADVEQKPLPLIKLDVASFVYLAVALVCIGYLVVYGQQYYWWQSVHIRMLFVLGLGSILLFILRQFRRKRPYIHLGIFKYKQYVWGLLVLFFMYLARFSMAYSGTFYKQVLGMDPRHISYMYAANVVGIVLGVALSALALIKKTNTALMWLAGYMCLFTYHLLMFKFAFYAGNEQYYILAMTLHGMGVGMVMVPVILFCISAVPYYLAPSAAAFCLIIRYSGYAASTALTKYFTVYYYQYHYSQFIAYITGNNQFYQAKVDAIGQMLKDRGMDAPLLSAASQKVLRQRLDNQILLRSIMDYYNLMMGMEVLMMMAIVMYWLYNSKYTLRFRAIVPI